ncbi:response regulator [Desulfofundulus thermobenzoicus]|uniref:Stage 0 sporulation protein A homolog n=1 Tax=Desulfofundulus thermobenzoicus TaxID=29376 RepID=A0A6N7IUR7_9FIRM|nr:response regulator [Desulfofundulus thermobenzoicus]MQL53187.1 response regulator [Desulfofundulus thermobenzoicus]
MKLLVADDEIMIRQGIRLMLESSPLLFDDILEADSGRTAVKLARQHSPEIILMDIKMPGLCGISAAREISRFNANCKIIFLTAYGRFDFAREAVRCRARDFLVKPVSREDLINTIEMCSEEIKQFIENNQREEQIKKELFCSLEEFLVNELVAGTALSPRQLWQKLQIISPPDGEPWFSEDRLPNICLVFSSDCQLSGYKSKKTRNISVKDASFPLLIEQMDKKLVCLSAIPASEACVQETSINLARALAGIICGQGGATINIGIGRVYNNVESLHQSYAEACRALKYGLKAAAARAGNEKYNIIHIDSIDENRVFSRPYQIAQQVINYLENNYNQKISLKEVAQSVYLNPVYLSTVFKQETGYTFSDYLTLIRVEKAKKLLDLRLPVKEVARQVGYPDSNYFCRIFKNVTGVTATDYRKNKTHVN